jgi:molecular chaperone DnaK (HSP70)
MFGRQAEMGVDPMDCVASGAAIQAAVLTGEDAMSDTVRCAECRWAQVFRQIRNSRQGTPVRVVPALAATP